MNAVEIQNLTKVYRLYSSPKDRLKEMLDTRGRIYHREFYALNNVSFAVSKGETLGIVGENGSGKSTLLQVVCGVLQPTSGSLSIHGRVAALLELGSGFNPEFTGRENAYLNGSLMGFDRREMDQRFPWIEQFAEIGDFINHPTKTYSTGMMLRLAFSVAINISPEILVIDEALAVGDAYFQHKCIAKIRELKKSGITLLFVSHAPDAVKTLCDRAILLDQGVVIRDETPDKVLDFYNALIAKKEKDQILQEVSSQGRFITRSGSYDARLEKVELVDDLGEPRRIFRVGEIAQVICEATFTIDIESPTFGFLIRDRLGTDIFGTNTFHVSPINRTVRAGERVQVRFRLPINLGIGSYSLSFAIHRFATHVSDNFDWWDQAIVFKVVPGDHHYFVGSAFLPVNVQVRELK